MKKKRNFSLVGEKKLKLYICRCTIIIALFFLILGDATVVWKQGNRVIYADRVHIGKELRASIVDNTSLVLAGVDTQYTGMYQIKLQTF